MTDLEELRFKVDKLARKWQRRMALDWWVIEFKFNEEEQEDYASTRAVWQYSHAQITWNLANLAKIDDELLEDTIVHELVHCLLDPITSNEDSKTAEDKFAEKAMEFATERTARAIVSTWRHHG